METETGLNLFFWTGTSVMVFSVLCTVLIIITYWNKIRKTNIQEDEILSDDNLENKNLIKFTKTELKVIELSARVLKSHKIAETMFISTRTVNVHKQNIKSKYGFDDMTTAMLYCIDNKMVVLDKNKTKNS